MEKDIVDQVPRNPENNLIDNQNLGHSATLLLTEINPAARPAGMKAVSFKLIGISEEDTAYLQPSGRTV